jgi:hypothetical protein
MAVVVRAVVLTIVVCLLFAVAGGLVATALNAVAPGYYPGVFPRAHESGYAFRFGRATGAFQGLALGFVAGVLLSTVLAWFNQLRLAGVVRSLGVIVGLASVAGVGGGLVGAAVGSFAPEYYRVAVTGGREPGFAPVDVGIGLGTSQGIILGVIVGIVLAIAWAWRRSRLVSSPSEPPVSSDTSR